MALPKDFPLSPYTILEPEKRWLPAKEELLEKKYGELLPPLVHKLRQKVHKWRASHYRGASATSRALLQWWFDIPHSTEEGEELFTFQYYFGQREAVETVIYLYEVEKARNPLDLVRYDSLGIVDESTLPEDWLRVVIKMATGSGKTKVMSLLIAWSYFHKSYEKDSGLARNFLLITPNIIVLDRLKSDFVHLKVFKTDPVLPENGFAGHDWKDDFRMVVHLQDEIGNISQSGNIFLTNIHRIYGNKAQSPSLEDQNTKDYFLGDKPVAKTGDSRVDLLRVVRGVNELIVLNDEAHHIHDDRLEWFQSIQTIHRTMKRNKNDLSLQIDLTATPKHTNGAIFVQTVSDYPLVEAIHQGVVKHPILPDQESRDKLSENKSFKFTEKYKDYIHLGYLEWSKQYQEHLKLEKKAVLFVMTDDTRSCDEVEEYLQRTYPELKNAILTIHTNNNGEIAEATTGKKREELERLRRAANEIDSWKSPYKAIVSVLMLKEGWDVKNVTTIVGLRPYKAKSNILPEQTLGRGLRRMYDNATDSQRTERVSVVGTQAFMEFVESLKSEGVELEQQAMNTDSPPNIPIIVEIDRKNMKKDIEKLDIEFPVLTHRIYRDYHNLAAIDIATFGHRPLHIRPFSEEEQKKIVLRYMTTGKVDHTTYLDPKFVSTQQGILGYFVHTIIQELRLVGCYDQLYEKVKAFAINHLFDHVVDLSDPNVLKNLAELEAVKTVIETFKKEINEHTVKDRGNAEIKKYQKVSNARPFMVREQQVVYSKKSAFNKIVGDGHFELQFADFLESCEDIISYAKNYFAVNFRIDYQSTDGNIRDYYPDFIVKVSDNEIYIVETKGREDLDDIRKFERLKQWVHDVNSFQSHLRYGALYVKQADYELYKPLTFSQLVSAFG